MDTQTIAIEEDVLLENSYQIAEPCIKLSETELCILKERIEEAKNGIFFSHEGVMRGLRELIENWKNGKSNHYLVAQGKN